MIDHMNLTQYHPLSVYFQNDQSPSLQNNTYVRDEQCSPQRHQFSNKSVASFGGGNIIGVYNPMDQKSQYGSPVSVVQDHDYDGPLPQQIPAHIQQQQQYFRIDSPQNEILEHLKQSQLNNINLTHYNQQDNGLQQLLGNNQERLKQYNQVQNESPFKNQYESQIERDLIYKRFKNNDKDSQEQNDIINQQDYDQDGRISSSFQNNDNYLFLKGIREVDDESLSLNKSGGKIQIGTSDKKQHQSRSIRQSLQNSLQNIPFGQDQLKDAFNHVVGKLSSKNSNSNPFQHNILNQILWSSGKSKNSSDQQLSFGGAFGQTEPVVQSHVFSGSRNLQNDNISNEKYDNHSYDINSTQKMLSKIYNQALVQMGEKACMRMTMKNLLINLDQLNQQMCRQSVHQEIILNEETSFSQLKQLLEHSLRDQKSVFQTQLDQKQEDLLKILQKKSNLELIEQIRMHSQMMQIRFNEFMSRENNIYSLYIEEKEQNILLQIELEKMIGDNNYKTIPNNQENVSRNGMQNYNEQEINLKFDEEQKFNSDYYSIKKQSRSLQSSPLRIKSYSQNKNQHQENMQTNKNIQIVQDLIRQLEDKDSYILNMKEQLEILRKDRKQYQDLKKNQFQGLDDQQFEVLKNQQDQLVDLHSINFNLKRQNFILEEQLQAFRLKQNQIGEGLNNNQQINKVQYELDLLRKELLSVNIVNSQNYEAEDPYNMNSLSSKKQIYDPSIQNSNTEPILLSNTNDFNSNQFQQTQIFNQMHNIYNQPVQQHLQNKSIISKTDDTNSMRINGEIIEQNIDQQQIQSTNRQINNSQHIQESQNIRVSVYSSDQYKQLQQVADVLNQKLKQQIELYQIQLERETKLLEKIQEKEFQYAEIRMITCDLQRQSKLNSDALDKAGKIIQKLNEDLQIEKQSNQNYTIENQSLRQDNFRNRNELAEMEQNVKDNKNINECRIAKVNDECQYKTQQIREAKLKQEQELSEEKNNLQKQMDNLQDQLNKQILINKSLEIKLQADTQQLNNQLSKKQLEALNMHDKNLSLKIQMKNLEDSLSQDIETREQFNLQQNMYLKNQINELKLKVNSYQTQSQQSYIKSSQPCKSLSNTIYIDQDGESYPRINQAYLNSIQDEYYHIGKELQKLKKIFDEKSKQTTENFIQKHMNQFDSFKLDVLDNLIDWHIKSSELAKLGNKYYDTLEEYKLLFVNMKQLIKDKDNALQNMKIFVKQSLVQQNKSKNEMIDTLEHSRSESLLEYKKMNKLLELQVKVKTNECEELIRYQEEFRFEYIKVFNERDDLYRNNQALDNKLRALENELSNEKGQIYGYKENLRQILGIQDHGARTHDIIHQHVESIIEQNKHQRLQLIQYQDQINQTSQDFQNQLRIQSSKINELEVQLEQNLNEYLQQQQNLQNELMQKELQYEAQVHTLSSDLQKTQQEVALKERQAKKYDQKIDQEISKQVEVQRNIESIILEKQKAIDSKNAIKDVYDLIEKKLQDTEANLDKKIEQIDQIDCKLKEAYMKIDRLEVDLNKNNYELEQKKEANERNFNELTREKQISHNNQQEYSNLKNAYKQITQEIIDIKENEMTLKQVNQSNLNLYNDLKSKNLIEQRTREYLEQEIKRYQDTVAYLSRSIDEFKLTDLDIKIYKKELENMSDILIQKENIIKDLYQNYINNPKNTSQTQTDDIDKRDKYKLEAQIYDQNNRIIIQQDEVNQLREVISRQMNDIDRLIEEKRQLEDELDSKNSLISNLNQKESFSFENVNLSNFNKVRHSSNSPNRQFNNENYLNLEQILNEKQNYIYKLEKELNEYRKQNHKLKDKLIVYELDTLGRAPLPLHNSTKKMNTGSLRLSNNINDRTIADSKGDYRSNSKGYETQNLNQFDKQIQPNYMQINKLDNKNFTQKVGLRNGGNRNDTIQESDLNYPNNYYMSQQNQRVNLGTHSTFEQKYFNTNTQNQSQSREKGKETLNLSQNQQQEQVKNQLLGNEQIDPNTNYVNNLFTLQQSEAFSNSQFAPYLEAAEATIDNRFGTHQQRSQNENKSLQKDSGEKQIRVNSRAIIQRDSRERHNIHNDHHSRERQIIEQQQVSDKDLRVVNNYQFKQTFLRNPKQINNERTTQMFQQRNNSSNAHYLQNQDTPTLTIIHPSLDRK